MAELRAVSSNVWGATADVTDASEGERFVSRAASALGRIDIVVCNVGGSFGGASLEASDEEWMNTLDINLLHSVRTIRAALPHMKKSGRGSVAIVSPLPRWKPGPGAQYGAAKASEIFLASSLAWELAPHRIRVNTVCPGSIMFEKGGWDRYQQNKPESFAAFLERDLPEGRLGTDQEVADVISFVVSERARWVNGALIPVDGAQGRPGAQWFGDA